MSHTTEVYLGFRTVKGQVYSFSDGEVGWPGQGSNPDRSSGVHWEATGHAQRGFQGLSSSHLTRLRHANH